MYILFTTYNYKAISNICQYFSTDIGQLVVRWFWEPDVVGSSPAIQFSGSHHGCLF